MSQPNELAVKGGKLSYRVFGNSGPPLVVVHGGPGLGCNYLLPQMSELGKFSSALFYDQRGTGNSSSTDDWQLNPFAAYCDDIETLRKNLKFEKISLLGHSFGGVFASFYALTYPDRVDKIIYVNSVPLSSTDYLEFVKHRTRIVDKNKDEIDAIRETPAFAKGDPETIERFYRLYFKNYFAKPQLANTLSLTMSPDAAINNFKIYNFFYSYIQHHAFSLYEKLQTLDKPSLIISGDEDVIPLHYMEHLHEKIPSSQFKVIKNCGHFSYIDQPEILYSNIMKFLQVRRDKA